MRRVGENRARRVDVRVVAASNRPLAGEAQAGRFRADLLVPARRHPDRRPAAARAAGRSPRPRGASVARPLDAGRLPCRSGDRGARGPCALRLAGQRPRAAERAGHGGRGSAGPWCGAVVGIAATPDRSEPGDRPTVVSRLRTARVRRALRLGRAAPSRRTSGPGGPGAGSHASRAREAHGPPSAAPHDEGSARRRDVTPLV